jgi:hypothetical protein
MESDEPPESGFRVESSLPGFSKSVDYGNSSCICGEFADVLAKKKRLFNTERVLSAGQTAICPLPQS